MEIINLPPPQTDFDFPLMKALALRRTKCKWKDIPLTVQETSNLLWAACGITQPETKRNKSKRTAPSACNSQEIGIYVVLKSGLYHYSETLHNLQEIHSEDIRGFIGTQKIMRSAPLGLVYVADFIKMKSLFFKSEQDKLITASADAGFISQNVYLYCAAAGLITAVLGLVNRPLLHQQMMLSEDQKVIYTQVVGHAS
jgi:SagB-type dehydrogenase family enzyme